MAYVTLEDVYTAFLSKLTEDEWVLWDEDEATQDWRTLLDGALLRFKFPRVSLEIIEDYFSDTSVSNSEIQVLAQYMKIEWLDRTILTWENVKPLYVEKDFSQANLIDKLHSLLEYETKQAKDLEDTYYRSVDHKPFDYTLLSGR